MTENALLSELQALKAAGLALDSLTVYRQLLDGDPVIGRLGALIDCCRQEQAPLSIFLRLYGDFSAALADSGADSLEDYLITAVLFHDNAFTRSGEQGRPATGFLEQAAVHDLDCLQQLTGLPPAAFKAYAAQHCSHSALELAFIDQLPEWQQCASGSECRPAASASFSCQYEQLRHNFRSCSRWSDRMQDLLSFHSRQGAGMFARYRGFYWNHTDGEGSLQGIANPDPVTLSDLIGYEAERATVIENTLQFLDGFPANNVLLYGDRGTGKSSTVKALLNEYHERGLRLVEVSKTQLFDFPEIIRQLQGRGRKFIIFVDDLSFEDSEGSYAALKAVLEGGIEHRPDNVLIYATSNRRHLIRERFGDRRGLSGTGAADAAPGAEVLGEVHTGDTVQEQLSLADRFGITVIFPTPDQDRYLEIAAGIAAGRSLGIDREQLRQSALNWERWHNGRSPRTARQFVDWLEGKLNRPQQ
jgi:predicted AAA+ superfamily ATPase